MALTTLPYPSMDFVPLDILTAEEMNQLVANIEAINNATIGTNQIADSSITTAKIANASVTSSKIDWTTLKFPQIDTSNVIQRIGTISASTWSMTFSQNGYFQAKLAANVNGSYVYAKLNDVDMFGFNGMGGIGQMIMHFFVPAGGTVKIINGGNGQTEGAVFYGVKWA